MEIKTLLNRDIKDSTKISDLNFGLPDTNSFLAIQILLKEITNVILNSY